MAFHGHVERGFGRCAALYIDMTTSAHLAIVPPPTGLTLQQLIASVQAQLDEARSAEKAARELLRELCPRIEDEPGVVTEGPLAPRLVDTDQAAALLGVSRSLMKQLLASGEMPSQKIGSLRRIAVSDIDAFVARRAADE